MNWLWSCKERGEALLWWWLVPGHVDPEARHRDSRFGFYVANWDIAGGIHLEVGEFVNPLRGAFLLSSLSSASASLGTPVTG